MSISVIEGLPLCEPKLYIRLSAEHLLSLSCREDCWFVDDLINVKRHSFGSRNEANEFVDIIAREASDSANRSQSLKSSGSLKERAESVDC